MMFPLRSGARLRADIENNCLCKTILFSCASCLEARKMGFTPIFKNNAARYLLPGNPHIKIFQKYASECPTDGYFMV
jgi:hypothetical protein